MAFAMANCFGRSLLSTRRRLATLCKARSGTLRRSFPRRLQSRAAACSSRQRQLSDLEEPSVAEGETVSQLRARESEFYESFSDWLKNDLDEATVSVPLGGSGLRGKWGTPDVVGVFKP